MPFRWHRTIRFQMKKLLLVLMATVFSVAAESRERINFDEGWRFTLGDSVQMAQTDYDDSSWRQLDLPHDWAIEGDFLDSNPSGAGGDLFPVVSVGIASISV